MRLNPLRLRPPAPWILVLQGALIAREHWMTLDVADRRRLQALIKKSRGLPSNLTPAERRDARRIVSDLDALGAGRKLLPLADRRRKQKRR